MYKELLHTFQHELTDDQRHVMFLRFLEEFSLRETAAILDKTVGNVKVIQIRALARLRNYLQRQPVKNLGFSPQVAGLPKISEA